MSPRPAPLLSILALTSCALIGSAIAADLPKTDPASRSTTTSGAGVTTAVRQGPRVLKSDEHGVGRLVRDVSFTDLADRTHKLSELTRGRTTVFALTSTSCPLSKKYLPTLIELAKTYAANNVRLVLVNAVATDAAADMQAAAARFGDGKSADAPLYVHDTQEQLVKALGALTTTDVVVLDAARTVVYHGAVDDQYGFGYAVERPRKRYLSDALEALIAGREPVVAATDAPGCALDANVGRSSGTPTTVTYHNRISRIVQQHCADCHRAGGVAPFALTTPETLAAHAPMIRQVVERGVMPPWFAAPSTEKDRLEWANDRTLAAADKADLLTWLAGSRPLGDKADAPQERTFIEGWAIGMPDAVFGFDKPAQVQATGVMPYQNIIVDTQLAEDKWVQAIEIRPGNRDVVHHALVFVHVEGDGVVSRDDQQEGGSGYWGVYVPGNSFVIYPEGLAKRLPKGAKLRFQMHYTPNGTATEDTTKMGIVYSKRPPERDVRVAGVINSKLAIPPRKANHREVATLRLPYDIEVLGFLPHMHLRGKACRYEVQTSKGLRTLLDIPRYDFNWQLLYKCAEPIKLSRGDTVLFTAWFDNSADNPANPDPSQTVRWGPQSFEEMQLGYIEYIVPGDEPGIVGPTTRAHRQAAAANKTLFQSFDADGDGAVSLEELHRALATTQRVKADPKLPAALLQQGDLDKNGRLDKAEFERLRATMGGKP